MENKKTNLFVKLSMYILILDILLFIFWPDINTIKIGLTLCIILSIITFIFSIIGMIQMKKNNEKGKGIAITTLIIGIILLIWIGYTLAITYAIEDIEFNDQVLCPTVTDCINNGDGTSTCNFSDIYEIPCSTDNLTEEQFK